MKREEVKAIFPEVTEEQMKAILDLNTGDIGKAKTRFEQMETERDGLKEQLEEANKKIGEFTSMDIDGIKKSADEWKTKYETDTNDLQGKLSQQAYEFSVKEAVSGMQFSSVSAKKAFTADLTEKKLQKSEDGKFLGFDDFVKSYKEADPTAFLDEGGKNPVFVGGATGGGVPSASNTLRAAMGLKSNEE